MRVAMPRCAGLDDEMIYLVYRRQTDMVLPWRLRSSGV